MIPQVLRVWIAQNTPLLYGSVSKPGEAACVFFTGTLGVSSPQLFVIVDPVRKCLELFSTFVEVLRFT
jgi:hypothetical protein